MVVARQRPGSRELRLRRCRRCDVVFEVCSSCDCGRLYCSVRCSTLAGIVVHRGAEARYQGTAAGKRNHSARQGRYRNRKCLQKVTDPTDAASLRSAYDPPATSRAALTSSAA